MTEHPFIPYHPLQWDEETMLNRAKEYYQLLNHRRSIRHFSDREIPDQLIDFIISTAGTAPSGANKQPWTFCVVKDPVIKSRIRIAAEKEEYESYQSRMSAEWLEDLAPLGTEWRKPFLEIAPVLIVVFRKTHDLYGDQKRKNYYVQESVGIASGILLSAIHQAGLVSLTHTPSPMNFLQEILQRPENEKPFLLIPIGYPAVDAMVPDIRRKALDEIRIKYP
ncbi:MAG: nitroreductase family protein [Saprospiraceae bacterium]|nr:nitroreductase family protein [Saprospiraceae bacterium]